MQALRTRVPAVLLLLGLALTSAASSADNTPAGADAGAPAPLPALAVEKLTPTITRITGANEQENMVLFDSPAGALLVDTGYSASTSGTQLRQTIASLTPRTVKYTVDTHWHPDHVTFNALFAQEGTLIAHENVKKRMAAPQTVQLFNASIPAYPAAALPEITFKRHVHLRLGAEDIDIRYFPNAHTDSDSAVFFRKAHVAVLGDMYISGAFPFADQPNGGRVLAQIKAFEQIIDLVDADDIIVPGHGPPTKGRDLCAYVAMEKDVVATVRAGIAARKSLATLQGEGLPKYASYEANGPIKAPLLIQFVYDELTGKYK